MGQKTEASGGEEPQNSAGERKVMRAAQGDCRRNNWWLLRVGGARLDPPLRRVESVGRIFLGDSEGNL